jgi:hypothetical protein
LRTVAKENARIFRWICQQNVNGRAGHSPHRLCIRRRARGDGRKVCESLWLSMLAANADPGALVCTAIGEELAMFKLGDREFTLTSK